MQEEALGGRRPLAIAVRESLEREPLSRVSPIARKSGCYPWLRLGEQVCAGDHHRVVGRRAGEPVGSAREPAGLYCIEPSMRPSSHRVGPPSNSHELGGVRQPPGYSCGAARLPALFPHPLIE
jgi:hypothetical protein